MTVKIHRVYFPVLSSPHKGYPGRETPRHAGQCLHYLIGELVDDRSAVGQSTGIAFPYFHFPHGHVVESCLDGQLISLDDDFPLDECLNSRLSQGSKIGLFLSSWYSRWHRVHNVEEPRHVKIVSEYVREFFFKSGAGLVGSKVRDRNGHFGKVRIVQVNDQLGMSKACKVAQEKETDGHGEEGSDAWERRGKAGSVSFPVPDGSCKGLIRYDGLGQWSVLRVVFCRSRLWRE